MKDTQKLVLSFIEIMKKIRPDIIYKWEYDEVEERYRIFHSYTLLHIDKNFRRKMNQAYARCFSEHSFYSVSVILDRKLTADNYVNINININDIDPVTIVKTDLETAKTDDKDMNSCSDEATVKIDNWSINRDNNIKTDYDWAA